MKKHNIKKDAKHTDKKSFQSKKLKWLSIILILAGIIIFVLIIAFAVRARNHFIELRDHQNYFRESNATIQDWMTIRSVVRHYNLSESEIYTELNVSPGRFIDELGVDNSTVVDRMTIQSICFKKHLDCNAVINRLNSIRAKY